AATAARAGPDRGPAEAEGEAQARGADAAAAAESKTRRIGRGSAYRGECCRRAGADGAAGAADHSIRDVAVWRRDGRATVDWRRRGRIEEAGSAAGGRGSRASR